MPSYETQVRVGRETLTVIVAVDSRLRKTARWTLHDKTITLRVPASMTRVQTDQMIADITPRIAKQRKRATRQTAVDLMARAMAINHAYFNDELSWHSIRWVTNMDRRLGSFTTGGTTDGDIRISERIRQWPAYVVDYVLAHEICHRKYPNHSAEFWSYLSHYPHVERALGFLDGIAHAEGIDPETLMD
ncbi:MAG: M48 family metallopeptidase [Chloroflexota bacterium]